MSNKNKTKDASELFENAINHYTNQNKNGEELKVLIKENSTYQLKTGNLQVACDMLEKMRSMNPDDFRILSKLINIYSKFDTDKAKR